MNEKDFAELAAGAALHALTPDEQERFLRALVEHPEWQAIVEADAATAAELAAPVAEEAPPAGIRASLLAQIAETSQGDGQTDAPAEASARVATATSAARDAVLDDSPSRAPRRWTRAVFALAACLALLVGVGVGAVALNDYLNRPASIVALQQIEAADDAAEASVTLDDGTVATAHWSPSLASSVLVTDGLSSPGDDKSYELWYVRGDVAVPAGVFDADGTTATAVLEGPMHEGDVIAVTVEQKGGSPNGIPTTDPIIVIPTA